MSKIFYFQIAFWSVFAQTIPSCQPCNFENAIFNRVCYGSQTIFPNSPYSLKHEFVKYRLCKNTAEHYTADYVVYARKDFPDTIRYTISTLFNSSQYIVIHSNPKDQTKPDTFRLLFVKSDSILVQSKLFKIDVYSATDGRYHFWNSELGIIKVQGTIADCYQSYVLSVADKRKNRTIAALLEKMKSVDL